MREKSVYTGTKNTREHMSVEEHHDVIERLRAFIIDTFGIDYYDMSDGLGVHQLVRMARLMIRNCIFRSRTGCQKPFEGDDRLLWFFAKDYDLTPDALQNASYVAMHSLNEIVANMSRPELFTFERDLHLDGSYSEDER